MKAFLSHSSADKESYVRIVASRLSAEDVVFDEISFEAGEGILDEIVRGLDESEVFVLFISNRALDSPWVRHELDDATLRLASGALKIVYPIIIDRDVKHDDPRIPKWLRDNYNLKLIPRPVVAARRIHQKLRQASWLKHPLLKERQSVFVGRNRQIEAFERRFDDFGKKKPSLSIVGGPPAIGRRSLFRNAIAKLALAPSDRSFPVIYLERHASIEDFILRIIDLGASEIDYASIGLSDRSVEEKVGIAVSALGDLSAFDERVIVLDEGCLVNYQRTLASWFESIVCDPAMIGRPRLFVASRWALAPNVARRLDDHVFSCVLGELDDSERRRLLGRLLELESLSLSAPDFETIADLLHGFPDEVYFAVDLISRYGIRGAIDRSHEIVEFNAEKASMLLRKFEGNERVLSIVRLLAQSEIFSVPFLHEVLGDSDLRDVIAELVSEHVCELIGAEGEFVRLIDSVRDHVKRNRLGLPEALRDAVAAAVKKDVADANWDQYDSSRVAFIVREGLKSGARIADNVLIPSHILRAMRDLYHERGDLRRLVQLADALLIKQKNLDAQLCDDVRYYLCLGLARLRDKRVLEEVHKIKGPEHSFILGYYYRLVGRHKDAIERLSQVLGAPFVEARAKRELVEVLLQTEQYDDARELARKNYEENRTNQFHIQAYSRALVLGTSPEKHKVLLERLCAELETVGSERARQMAMIGRALIAARCDHDRRALALIDDAMAAFPTVVYPVLAKFDISLYFKDDAGMSDALARLSRFAKEGRSISPRTYALQRAYRAAFHGDLDTAMREVEDLLRDYPDAAKDRLRDKLKAMASAKTAPA